MLLAEEAASSHATSPMPIANADAIAPRASELSGSMSTITYTNPTNTTTTPNQVVKRRSWLAAPMIPTAAPIAIATRPITSSLSFAARPVAPCTAAIAPITMNGVAAPRTRHAIEQSCDHEVGKPEQE